MAVGAPFFFIASWLFVTTLIPKLSGWSALRQIYPDDPLEQPIGRFSWEAMYLGKGGSKRPGVSYRGCVVFEPCESGLRIEVFRIFHPFSGPVFIPWDEIDTEMRKVMMVRMCALFVGEMREFKITVMPRLAERLSSASNGALKLPEAV
ncbi:MAG: hypothetical protein SXU28_07880 [Pseudomonadota bacterium]|nr:hypothetical protein [Pseudomonadota bacterium]